MWKRYRETFDGIRASGRLREEVLNMREQKRNQTKRDGLVLRPVLAGVLAVCLLSTIAFAAVPGALEMLSDYFIRWWDETNDTPLSQEKLALLDNFSQVVGVSDTSNGVTVTLEAVTCRESAIWMLVTVDGLETPAEELLDEYPRFAEGRLWLEPVAEPIYRRTNTISWPVERRVTEDGRLMFIFEVYETPTEGITFLTGGQAVLEFEGIYTYNDPDGTYHVQQRKDLVAEGFWRLEFELEPVDADDESIVLNDVMVSIWDFEHEFWGAEPAEIQSASAQEIRISSTGAQVIWSRNNPLLTFDYALLLEDGTEVAGKIHHASGGISFRPASQKTYKNGFNQGWFNQYDVIWQIPVDLSQAIALRAGDEIIPLKY